MTNKAQLTKGQLLAIAAEASDDVSITANGYRVTSAALGRNVAGDLEIQLQGDDAEPQPLTTGVDATDQLDAQVGNAALPVVDESPGQDESAL